MKSLSDCHLYGILDLGYVKSADARRVAAEMIDGGVDLLQLRGKEESVDTLADLAAQLHKLTASASVPLIINDHAEIAARVPLEGVHLGQDDDSIMVARKKADRHIVIGKSTHHLGHAMAARDEGADYIGFGPIFATPTKPDYLPTGTEEIAQVHKEVSLPIFCIGGIKLENLESVIAAGARRVVIVSGILQAADIAKYVRSVKKLLSHASTH